MHASYTSTDTLRQARVHGTELIEDFGAWRFA